MNRNKVGRFRILRELVERDEFADALSFLRFVPVRTECLYHSDEIEYQGYCEHFDEIPAGEIIPLYVIKIDSGAGSLVKVERVSE